MDHAADTGVPDLQRALAVVEEKRPALRLLAAIAHARGVSQSELAVWFGVERKTIYNWLRRFEGGDPVAAARDGRRPGRPHKLSGPDRDRLLEVLGAPPSAAGLDAPAWTTARLQRYVRDRFGVAYSPSSCRRLLREAGLVPRTPGAASDEPTPGQRDASGDDDTRAGPRWVPE
jgi:transposase